MSTWIIDIDAFDAKTAGLSAAQEGVYGRLIRFYYQTGKPLPDDDIQLSIVANVPIDEWRAMSGRLRALFETDGYSLRDRVIDLALARQLEKAANGDLFGTAPARPVDMRAKIFSTGIAFLSAAGIRETQARSLLGKWRREHGDAAVIEALAAADGQSVSAPVEWIQGFFRRRTQNGSTGKRDSAGQRLVDGFGRALATRTGRRD